jgi:hypothetical protein
VTLTSFSDVFLGGLHLALRQSRLASSPVKAFDWDQTACQVYAANYGAKMISRVGLSFIKSISGIDLREVVHSFHRQIYQHSPQWICPLSMRTCGSYPHHANLTPS